MEKSPHENDCVWSELGVQLVRYYEKAPSAAGRKGTFNSRYLNAWFIKQGHVIAKKERETVRAGEGQWLILVPGMRYQEFSEDAQLISLNLDVRCGLAILSWVGFWGCIIDEGDKLVRLAKRVGKALGRKAQDEDHGLSIPRAKMAIPEAVDCQVRVMDFFRTLLHTVHAHGIQVNVQYGQDERVRKSMIYLSARSLEKRFSRREVAQHCGLSASQLDRLWRDELGITARQYWDRRRMNYACRCLREKSKSIKEVSADLGFAYATQFSLWFSSSQGVSPRAYRQAIV